MLAWLRLDIVRLFFLALPALVVFLFLLDREGSWTTAAIVLAIAVGAWALWQLDDGPIALGPRFFVFFLAYCLLFSYAAGTRLLSGPRELLAGYDQVVPRNFLSLDRWADWHYRFAPPIPPAPDLVVITLPSVAGQLREEVRLKFAALINQALEADARGIAFDYFPTEDSMADRLLIRSLSTAEAKGMPVVFGYLHGQRDGILFRRPLAESLSQAIPLERLGHLAGYRESDGQIRMIPIDLDRHRGLPALSWRIASLLGEEVRGPKRGLLRFLEPVGGVRVEPFSAKLDPDLLRDRFLIVGTASASDQRQTPFGQRQGVVLHAYAAHGLRTGYYVRHANRRLTFPLIFLLCYVLALREARAVPRRTLLLTAAGLSALAVATVATAMRLALVWIDLAYPLVAIWGLAAMLIGGRYVRSAWRARQQTPRSTEVRDLVEEATAPHMRSSDGFDVFLSHNGRDKDDVRPVARAIENRGLAPWLDEEQLAPGRPWQEGLEEILRTVRSSAVFVGKSGLGPWEIPEMRVSLSECVRRGLPVIPVLLPGAGDQPTLPLFLTQYTWVDLRGGLTEASLDRLEWGITGVKPQARRPAPRTSTES